MRKSKEERTFQIIGNVVMVIMTILAVAPILLVLIVSLTDNQTLIREGYRYFPKKWSLAAYEYIFLKNPQIVRAYLVSFELTAAGTACSLAITTTLAYAISRRGRDGASLHSTSSLRCCLMAVWYRSISTMSMYSISRIHSWH